MTISRRDLLKQGLLAAGALALAPGLFAGDPPPAVTPKKRAAGEKLRFGVIGVGGRGNMNLGGISGVATVAALCDVDADTLAGAAKRHAQAKTYRDYRELLDQETDLDGVVVSTPDHMHAPISMSAMAKGLHVYCEKPLTRTVWEARQVAKMAATPGLATQMGNQGSSDSNLRRAVEVIRSGTLGAVKEVHCWTDRPVWPQGLDLPKADSAPEKLDWNLWLGVAAERPFVGSHHPFKWRAWHDFGAGAIGDIACHCMNLPFHACDLTDPSEIEAVHVSDTKPACYPKNSIIRYAFPERGTRKALELWWYDGGKTPSADRLPEVVKSRGALPSNGCLIVCEGGVIFSDGMYGGGNYLALKEDTKLFGLAKHKAVIAIAASMGRSKGHYADLAAAARGGALPLSNFVTAAKLTEVGILGCIATRFRQKKLQWDQAGMRFPNLPEADALLTPKYRDGWSPVMP